MTSDRSALSTSPSLAPAVGPRALAALAGGVAATLALGLSELLAGILPGATSLVAAVGQVVIDLQPAGAKDLVVALFGTNDKLALELFVSLVAIAAVVASLTVVRQLQEQPDREKDKRPEISPAVVDLDQLRSAGF